MRISDDRPGASPANSPEAERQRLARLIGRLLARHWLRTTRPRPPAGGRPRPRCRPGRGEGGPPPDA
jgi:hypothetical protein